MSVGKMFKISVVTLLLVSSSLIAIPILQPAQSSPDQTGLPTYWPSVYLYDGTAYSYNATFTGEVGDMITVALMVSNLTDATIVDPQNPTITHPLGNLNGFDIQLSWDPTVLKYINHTVTVPVEDYPDPVPPSTYAGILHAEAFEVMNKVDEADNIPMAEPGTMAWFSYAIMPGVEVFNGNGTLFIMTFNVTKHGSSPLKLTNVDLSGDGGTVLVVKHHEFDGVFRTASAPTADFTFWPDIGVVDKPVIFNASASYSPVGGISISKYIWDFDDRNVTTVNDPILTHSYNKSDTYTVSLVVEDSDGVRSSPKTEQVSIVEKRNVKIVDVSLMPAVNVLVNRTVDVKVWVENDGRADETFKLKAYYNATAVNWADISTTTWVKIGETNVSLPLGEYIIEHLTWNTTGVPAPAYYYVLANATLCPYEEYSNDNNMTSSDALLVRSTPLRDVAIEKLELGWSEAFKSPVLEGEKTTFQITVLNTGTENETAVNITLYYDGSVLKSWNESIPYGETIELTCTELFDPGSYNITGQATIEVDANPDNNLKNETLRVIETPRLNFTYDPKTPYVNQSVILDASASSHKEPGASITEYTWQIYDPGATLVKTLKGSDLVNITYEFAEEGEWRVVLSVKDSWNIEYKRDRLETQAYQKDARINVQTPPGFPFEYILVIIAIIIAVLAVIIYRRLRTRT